MVYRYRITLAGIKGFFRVYAVNSRNSLYTFHKQIRSDLEFPVDQPILFKALDESGNVLARYALVDLGYGTVDEVTLADTVKAGVASFVYFYDIQSKKSVIITFEGQDEKEDTAVPKLLESKGPVPAEFDNGYVAFEDLPTDNRKPRPSGGGDDDDEDDDDDDDENDSGDDDIEEEELIYDEEEDRS